MTTRTLAVGLFAVLAALLTMTLTIGSAPRGMLVLPDMAPTVVPTKTPTHIAVSRVPATPPPLATRPPVLPTPSPAPQLLDLNFATTGALTALGLTPDQARQIFVLRCTPAQPPYIPYAGELEGCGPAATGIVRLRQIVDAGILTAEEVVEFFSGKVVQTWD